MPAAPRRWDRCRHWSIEVREWARPVVVFASPELEAPLLVRVCRDMAQAQRSARRARDWIRDGCPGGVSFSNLCRAASGQRRPPGR